MDMVAPAWFPGLVEFPPGMFEQFSDPDRLIVVQAQEEARQLDHDSIGTEHLMLAALRFDVSAAARALGASGVTYDAALPAVETAVVSTTNAPAGHIPYSTAARHALVQALDESVELGADHVGTAHVVLGLIRTPEGLAYETLVRLGVDIEELRTNAQLLAAQAHESVEEGPELSRLQALWSQSNDDP
jgi:ATP-dependent Clp protease ATP-binding subunit ClpC